MDELGYPVLQVGFPSTAGVYGDGWFDDHMRLAVLRCDAEYGQDGGARDLGQADHACGEGAIVPQESHGDLFLP